MTPAQAIKPIDARLVDGPTGQSIYPEEYSAQVAGRTKRRLGDHFQLSNFGVNLTELAPGTVSALRHYHHCQDEFIYILEGTPTLVQGNESCRLSPGQCCGFKAGDPVAHQVRNDTDSPVRYLEIGDRRPGDSAEFPFDDIQAVLGDDQKWKFTRKDGSEF